MTSARKKAKKSSGTVARHRAKDPSTSRAAAAFVRDKLTNLENVMFGRVKRAKNRGRIVDDLVDETGIDKVTVSPRMRPLAEKGLIFASEDRRPGKSGVNQIVWKHIKWKPKTSARRRRRRARG